MKKCNCNTVHILNHTVLHNIVWGNAVKKISVSYHYYLAITLCVTGYDSKFNIENCVTTNSIF